jgi:gluconolactonase
MKTPRRAALALLLLLAALPARAAERETLAADLQFPEGTIYVGDTLYFVDYAASAVLRLAGRKVETVWHQSGCGANGLAQVPDGLLVACFDSGALVRISLGGQILETIRQDASGAGFTAPNDLAADARGGTYFTASGAEGRVPGKVYYLDAGHRVSERASGIRFANGLVVSPDGRRLIVAETPASRLLAFAIADDGTLSGPTLFADLDAILAPHRHYSPDGVRRDAHGNLFVALYDGGGFAILDPDGRRLAQIDVPGAHHSNLALAPDGRSVTITAIDDLPGGGYRGRLDRLANPLP